MIVEMGHFLAAAALALALLLGVLPMWGAARGHHGMMAMARPLTLVLAVSVALSYAALTHAFIACDFSVTYVARHANSALPLTYRVAGVWGGHEGSLLLWVVMLAGWAMAVAAWSRALPLPFVARVLAVLGLITAGFLLFMLLTSNPFERLLPPPPDGRDLNPLLQDPGMVAHPPMLYMGYVGFSVAFAFAIAALLGGQLDAQWARWSRPWTTAAWACLTVGIMLGSWWAYYELGWGGWWFWDPVENASFMPWLAGTALIHSLAVTEKRNSFKSWTVLLAITTFSLSLLGTFLVRSGVLSSVHAFATDPRRGVFILGFLVLVIGTSLLLYAWRAPRVGLGQRFGLWSREAAMLSNNVLLMVAVAAVLLGTLYPLILDALQLGKISVGAPYFETVLLPLLLALCFLLGAGPALRWKQGWVPSLMTRLVWAFGVAVGAALLTGWLAGRISLTATLGLWMAWWIAVSVALEAWHTVRPAAVSTERERHGSAWRPMRRATVGMLAAHLGVAVFALGVSMVKTYEAELDAPMAVGDSVELGGHRFTLVALQTIEGPNYSALQAQVAVRPVSDSRAHEAALPTTVLTPEKRVYRVQRLPMTEASIDRGITRDLYVAMGEPLPDGRWLMRVHHKPFVNWIWGGCLIMAVGGLVAASDRRYRQSAPGAARAGAAEAGQASTMGPPGAHA